LGTSLLTEARFQRFVKNDPSIAEPSKRLMVHSLGAHKKNDKESGYAAIREERYPSYHLQISKAARILYGVVGEHYNEFAL
jgi:hypothetical protein